MREREREEEERKNLLSVFDLFCVWDDSADLVDIKGVEKKEVNSLVSLMAILHDYRPIQSITIKVTSHG